jgi:hypothetical protein
MGQRRIAMKTGSRKASYIFCRHDHAWYEVDKQKQFIFYSECSIANSILLHKSIYPGYILNGSYAYGKYNFFIQ